MTSPRPIRARHSAACLWRIVRAKGFRYCGRPLHDAPWPLCKAHGARLRYRKRAKFTPDDKAA